MTVLAIALIATPLLTEPAQATDPYIGQIILFGGNFAIRGYALCNGQLLAISSNPALFSILGTTYGGDGRTTFALPDLRGRVPVHFGTGPGLSSRFLGQKFGAQSHTLSIAQMPSHNHTASGVVRATSAAGNSEDPAGNVLAQENREDQYRNGGATPDVSMAANTVAVTVNNNGGNQSFNLSQPSLVINFQIALTGVFPPRN
ncbi:MAG: phage tail protein [Planctomycetota bacterium]|jgi:microcystin-dependent protein